MKEVTGAITEHWLDKALREHRNINLEGNYIRIPASAMVKLQEIRNQRQKKKLSLIEQQRQWEEQHKGETV